MHSYAAVSSPFALVPVFDEHSVFDLDVHARQYGPDYRAGEPARTTFDADCVTGLERIDAAHAISSPSCVVTL